MAPRDGGARAGHGVSAPGGPPRRGLRRRALGRRAAMGSGDHGYSAFLDVDALVAAYGAVVADLAD